MSAARQVPTIPSRARQHAGDGIPYPPSGTRRTTSASYNPGAHAVDPIEEALLARSPWVFSEPDGAVRELLERLAVGDEEGAIATVRLIAAEHPLLVATVSADVLDEIELDRCAALFLAHIDGRAELSRVLVTCPLAEADCVRTLCELIDRRIVALRRQGP
jgi:hypothetical protein